MGAIDPRDVFRVPGTCIKCQCCVRKCTRHAKYFDDPAFLSHVAMLEQTGQAFVIRPPIPLEIGSMERDPAQLRRVYTPGGRHRQLVFPV